MEWRKVPGYESYLEVNELGDVRSVERYVNHKNGSVMRVRPKILTQHPDPKGYWKVTTSFDCRRVTLKVHRLVAMAFLQNHENKPQVDHIDGDKSNNRADNLRWVTNRENFDLSVENDLRKKSFEALIESQKNPTFRAMASQKTVERCQKTTYCYSLDGLLIEKYPSNAAAAQAINGCSSGVSACCCGKMKKYKGFIFSYNPNL